MKPTIARAAALIILAVTVACSNTGQRLSGQQTGAIIGAGAGAIAGQALGGDTASTVIGAGIGAVAGAVMGNAVEQSEKAAAEAARTNQPVVYYDDHGGRVEAVPDSPGPDGKCRQVTTRTYEDGKMTGETVEEICEE